jgi:hypothetical protein
MRMSTSEGASFGGKNEKNEFTESTESTESTEATESTESTEATEAIESTSNTKNNASVKERKVSQSASSKIDSIIRQLFLPMIGMSMPERTSFMPEDAEDQIMRQVARERPSALTTESDFVDYMVLLYRKFQQDQIQFVPALNQGSQSQEHPYCALKNLKCVKRMGSA